jgi:hypothetical protein
MKYKPYMHIEKLGTDEVEGIEIGTTFVFPKVDGTNASVWLDGNEVKAGSRTRQLSLGSDNAGFYAWVLQNTKLGEYLGAHPNHRLHGEWLVPHTIKHYREDAWRRFWIFDVSVDIGVDEEVFLSYDAYHEDLEKFGLDYIIPMFRMENATYEYLFGALERNKFLIDSEALGEGIVVKNYDFRNRYGRTVWAKIVRQDFKEANQKAFGVATIGLGDPVEKLIVDRHLTDAMIDKVHANIVTAEGKWESKMIPRLLETCFYDLVREEIWPVMKSFKLPTINFKALKAYTVQRVKAYRKDLF